MLTLQTIIRGIKIKSIAGASDVLVQGIAIDSRQVEPGFLFAAIKGTLSDGHEFINQAIEKGAVVVLCNELPAELKAEITYILVANSAEATGIAAHNFYDKPSYKVVLVGVTGTNGKTTIATLLFRLFRQLGYSCGLISTVQNQIDDTIFPSTHTTPDAVQLNQLLHRMTEAGCSHIFMESSSHAIHQHRMAGLHFAGAVFSNITHDHLDYHKTFDEYIRVKKSFFDGLPDTAFALSNLDDKRGEIMLQNTRAKRIFYSLLQIADIKGKIIDNSLSGLVMDINGREVHLRLIGTFNAYNILAVYGAAVALGEDADQVMTALSLLTGAEGRFEVVISRRDHILGIIDYAHTPDALLNVLTTIDKMRKGNEAVITVVGCGGDRDKAKRPVMAEVACEYSSHAIFTSDNPRKENPFDILADMQHGLKSEYKRRSRIIEDRRKAIQQAVEMANPGDIVLIAGKGHEKYQEIAGVRYHFDDKEELGKFFENR